MVVLHKLERTEYINEEIALSNIWRQLVTEVRSSEATRGESNSNKTKVMHRELVAVCKVSVKIYKSNPEQRLSFAANTRCRVICCDVCVLFGGGGGV